MNSALRTWILKILARVSFYAIVIGMFCLACLCPAANGQNSSSVPQVGNLSGVRRVLRSSNLSTTRYSRIHDFDVYFSMRSGLQTYCLDYETVVLDEISELMSAEGKDLEILLNQKNAKVTLYTPQHRKLKARIVQPGRCASVSLAGNR